MKDTGGQGGVELGLFKHFWEMFNFSGTAGGSHRYGDIVPKVIDKFNIIAAIGALSKVNLSSGNLESV
ncbi:MAG: hypothetical protein AMJ61_12140 [Desulfobacterales bacterium SG8_35_2]|nr:MAG: hypothetical protein AMJ61_12140 [Desulfobacterales bacterium SG8_35_2]